ncbi:MAG TPA: T9SS type A sorting domain-containing protein [Bacteroidales bacterium]|nr:T9SS type A sorting domain-containing protein [Bacteroidales bacterium]
MNRLAQFIGLIYLLVMLSPAFAQHAEATYDSLGITPPLSVYQEEELIPLMTVPPLPVPHVYLGPNAPLLPPQLDNSTKPFFRGVFQQDGLSCGQATLVSHTFTYEVNRLRNLPGNVPANQYPTHFAWNWVNGGDGWFGASYFHSIDLLRRVGTPNVATYGGMAAGGGTRWMTGYENYYAAMLNRIHDGFSINVSTIEGLNILKHYLHDHLEGSPHGGIVSFYANQPALQNLPAGTPEAGKKVVTQWSTANHAMTFVGWHDSICWDYSGDGQYTNHIDINGDGVVNLRDWEIGGLIMVNTYGGVPNWGNGGFAYVMYKTLGEAFGSGGIWNSSVHVVEPKATVLPQITMKITLKHTSRNKLKVWAGVSPNPNATEPLIMIDFPIIDFHGAHRFLQGGSSEAHKTLEFGLDLTPLLGFVSPGQPARFFFRLEERDPANAGTGEVVALSLRNYTSGTVNEIICSGLPMPIVENGITNVWLNATINYNPVTITTQTLPAAKISEPYSHQLSASGGTPPYRWNLKMDYDESSQTQNFPNISAQNITPSNANSGTTMRVLPFPFPYYGKLIDTVYVHVDGIILFDRQNFPWPYYNEPMVLFKGYRGIAPFLFDLRIESGQGIWYEGNSELATFRWKASLNGVSGTEVNIAAKLYPNGKIEFFYGAMQYSQGIVWVGGISAGDYRNYQTHSKSGASFISNGLAYLFEPPDFAFDMQLTTGGILHGTPDQVYTNCMLKVMTVDNNGLSTIKHLAFNTRGFKVYYTIAAGDDDIIGLGETVQMGITLVSHETQPYSGISATLLTDDSAITMIDSTFVVPIINPGDSLHFPEVLSFEVTQVVLNNYPLDMNLQLTSGTEIWNNPLHLTINAPQIHLASVMILDGANGALDPGETVQLVIRVKNSGSVSLDAVQASIATMHPGITITDGVASLPWIQPEQTASLVFSVSANPSMVVGQNFAIDLNVSGSTVYSGNYNLILPVGLLVDNFESGGLASMPWFSTGGNHWGVVQNTPFEGLYCALSGVIGHNDTTSLELIINVTVADTISFYRKVSSESNFDFLRFYINGIQRGSWSGEQNWNRVRYPIPAGRHTLKWAYIKDQSDIGGTDNAMIDFVEFPPLLMVDAGGHALICEGAVWQLQGGAANQTSVAWSSSGSGTFSNTAIFNPIYTPSQADISEGSVQLMITAYSTAPCPPLSSETTLWFNRLPTRPVIPSGPDSVNVLFVTQSTFISDSIAHAQQYDWLLEPQEAGVLNANGLQATVEWNTTFTGQAAVKIKGLNDCGEGPFSLPKIVLIHQTHVGVAPPTYKPGINIQPNPFKERFVITISDSFELPFILRITNQAGQVVLKELVNTHIHQVITSAFSPGMYIVSLSGKHGIVHTKAILY